MPKGKIEVKRGNNSRALITLTRKFKIGGRKSVKSALLMSNEALRTVLTGAGRPKDKLRARNELTRRGAAFELIPAPAEVSEAEAA
jgi:hypothetical protein